METIFSPLTESLDQTDLVSSLVSVVQPLVPPEPIVDNDVAGLSPEELFPNGLGRNRPLVIQGFPIAVCWAYKSACTTTLKWFLFHNNLLNEANVVHPNWPHTYWNARLDASADYIGLWHKTLLGQENKLVVKVIRDPALRAVSTFFYFLRFQDEYFATQWQSLIAWKISLGLGDEPTATFEQYLLHIIAARSGQSPLDMHLEPQWDPLQDPAVNVYITVEQYDAKIRSLEQVFNLKESPLERFSQSAHHNEKSDKNLWPKEAAGMAIDKTHFRYLGFPSPDSFLTESTRSLIRIAYAPDYNAYSQFYA